jgi:hypothetical protein
VQPQESRVQKIPLYCHNLKGYDSHFIIKALGCDNRIVHTTALPANGQKLRTFKVNSYNFVDSFDFMQGSLSDLVSDLPDSHSFDLLDQSQLYDQGDAELKNLLLQKGVYCYEWATSLKKLKRTKELPAHRHFYSRLSNKNISTADYNHAKAVFAKAKCKNMLEYTKLYCLLDVFLLAEVMFAFRDEIHSEIGLDCW